MIPREDCINSFKYLFAPSFSLTFPVYIGQKDCPHINFIEAIMEESTLTILTPLLLFSLVRHHSVS